MKRRHEVEMSLPNESFHVQFIGYMTFMSMYRVIQVNVNFNILIPI